MELFKEIILEGLKSEKIELSLLSVTIDTEKIVHDIAYKILLEIKQILENDKLSDFDCVEEIMRTFKNIGGIDYRHDF